MSYFIELAAISALLAFFVSLIIAPFAMVFVAIIVLVALAAVLALAAGIVVAPFVAVRAAHRHWAGRHERHAAEQKRVDEHAFATRATIGGAS
jgi:hypothetical protein